MKEIPAISIRQPWAELILTGEKSIEIRSWYPDYRGRLWVHTGFKGIPELEKETGLADLFKGGYVGSVVLEAIISLNRERWEAWRFKHLCSDEYKPGLYAWILSSHHKFENPIPGPGRLNLFYPPAELQEMLHQANSANTGIETAAHS